MRSPPTSARASSSPSAPPDRRRQDPEPGRWQLLRVFDRRRDRADLPERRGRHLYGRRRDNGTVGGPSAGAFDFVLYQTGHQERLREPRPLQFAHPRPSAHAIRSSRSPEPTQPPHRPTRPARERRNPTLRHDECGRCRNRPRRVGAAAGVRAQIQVGDETNFAALAPHPSHPQSAPWNLLAGAGGALGRTGFNPLARYPVTTSGRVNRQFRDISSPPTAKSTATSQTCQPSPSATLSAR